MFLIYGDINLSYATVRLQRDTVINYKHTSIAMLPEMKYTKGAQMSQSKVKLQIYNIKYE